MKDMANSGRRAIRIFLDTNILLDYLYFRGEEALAVEHIFDACISGSVDCCIAAHALTDLFYIIRKDFSASDRKQIVLNLCSICDVQDISSQTIEKAISANYSDDLEDSLQMQCALESGSEILLTRDKCGFGKSPVKVMLPHEIIKQLKL